MKFSKLDTVSVLSGKFAGKSGQIVGFSQVHRNGKPDVAEYQVTFRSLNITEEFVETDLILVEKYNAIKAEKERQEEIARNKIEQERIAEEKMNEALRKKIEREIQIREEVEMAFATKKAEEKAAAEKNSIDSP
jgi:ribosomal protein L24